MKSILTGNAFAVGFRKLLSCADDGADGRSASDKLLCIGFSILFFAGAMIALFGIATVKMLAIAAVAGAAMWFLRRRLSAFTDLSDFVSRRRIGLLCAVVCVGLILRALFYYVHLDTALYAYQPGDGKIFFNEAREMAAGAFPETKSWVTVGGYALLIRLFGESLLPLCLLNILLQTACLVLLYLLGRRMFGQFAALLAAMAFYWSPIMVSMSFQLYAEHFFYPLVLLQFLLLYKWSEGGRVSYAAAIGLLIVASLWTKPDAGIFMTVIMTFVTVANSLMDVKKRKRLWIGWCIAVAVIGCGLFAGHRINLRYHGTRTCLCSEDGYWPRYFGANRATLGRTKLEDKLAVYEAYRKETGRALEFRHNHCPSELVPYLKAEIRRRWASMSVKEKLLLIHAKESHSWRIIEIPGYRWVAVRKTYAVCRVVVWLAACAALLRLARRALVRRVDAVDVLRVLPILYLIGMFLCIMIVEANFRYTTCANVFWPLYLGCEFGCATLKGRGRGQ